MQFPGPGVQYGRLELAGLEQLAQRMLCIRVPLPRLVLLLVQGVGRIRRSNAERASLPAPSYFAVLFHGPGASTTRRGQILDRQPLMFTD